MSKRVLLLVAWGTASLLLTTLLLVFGLQPQHRLQDVLTAPGVAGQLRFLQHHPGMRVVTVVVEIDVQRDDRSAVEEVIGVQLEPLLAQGVRRLELDYAAIYAWLRKHLPSTILADDWSAIRQSLQPEALTRRLISMRQHIQGDGSPIILDDCLGLSTLLQHSQLAPQSASFVPVVLLLPDGEHAAQAACRQILDCAVDYPGPGTMHVLGPAVSMAHNRQVLLQDLFWALPLSLLGIAGLVVIVLRRWYGTLVIVHDAILACGIGMVVQSLLYAGQPPLVSWAILPLLLGLAVDCGIHVQAALSQAAAHLRQVSRAMVTAVVTSLAVCLPLFFTDDRLLTAVASLTFVSISSAGCLAVARLVLGSYAQQTFPSVSDDKPCWILPWSWKMSLLLATLGIAVGVSQLRLADPAALRAGDPQADRIEQQFRQVSGQPDQDIYLAVQADDLAGASERLLHVVRQHDLQAGLALRLLLDENERQKRWQAWNEFWQENQETLRQHLPAAARAAGISPALLAGSLKNYAVRPIPPAEPLPLAADVQQLLLGGPMQQGDGKPRWQLHQALPAEVDWRALLTDSEQIVLGRAVLGWLLMQDLLALLMWLIPVQALCALTALALTQRSLPATGRTGVALVLCAFGTLGCCGWLGIELTAVHALVFALCLGICLDDAVFLQAGLSARAVLRPVCLTSASTAVAALVMLCAQHPVVVSSGQVLLLGSIWALVGALWCLRLRAR